MEDQRSERQGIKMLNYALRLRTTFLLLIALLAGGAQPAPAQELRPGVWPGRDLSALPLPVTGYQVYLLGELHGVKETEEVFMQYLARLSEAGLRDVAFEERGVYQPEGEAYVEGRSSALPAQLCLRVGILGALRRFNQGRNANEIIRVHFVDVDSPAPAIRQHLLSIQERVARAKALRVPDAAHIKAHGPEAVAALERLTTDPQILRELRTVRYSIRVLQQGLEFDISQPKGSPYINDREEAVARNLMDLAHDGRPVLALYGSDHVSRKLRTRMAGPERNQDYSPVALRLQNAGVKVFSMVTYPLSGSTSWRGRRLPIFWTPSEGHLDGGETLDRLLAAAPEATFFYVDRQRQHIKMPNEDADNFVVDAFLLWRKATPMEDHCQR
jgi:hypothetical protein